MTSLAAETSIRSRSRAIFGCKEIEPHRPVKNLACKREEGAHVGMHRTGDRSRRILPPIIVVHHVCDVEIAYRRDVGIFNRPIKSFIDMFDGVAHSADLEQHRAVGNFEQLT